MFCSGLHPVLSCWELPGCVSFLVILPSISASRCFVGLFVYFQVKFPVSTSQLLPKPHVQHCRPPDPLGCAGAVGTGCQWDAGQGPGTAPGDSSAQEVLPDRNTSMPFGAECFSRCLWVRHSLWSVLWLLCAVASQALITNCSSLAAGIFYFELVYSWQQSGGCRSFLTCCSAGL